MYIVFYIDFYAENTGYVGVGYHGYLGGVQDNLKKITDETSYGYLPKKARGAYDAVNVNVLKYINVLKSLPVKEGSSKNDITVMGFTWLIDYIKEISSIDQQFTQATLLYNDPAIDNRVLKLGLKDKINTVLTNCKVLISSIYEAENISEKGSFRTKPLAYIAFRKSLTDGTITEVKLIDKKDFSKKPKLNPLINSTYLWISVLYDTNTYCFANGYEDINDMGLLSNLVGFNIVVLNDPDPYLERLLSALRTFRNGATYPITGSLPMFFKADVLNMLSEYNDVFYPKLALDGGQILYYGDRATPLLKENTNPRYTALCNEMYEPMYYSLTHNVVFADTDEVATFLESGVLPNTPTSKTDLTETFYDTTFTKQNKVKKTLRKDVSTSLKKSRHRLTTVELPNGAKKTIHVWLLYGLNFPLRNTLKAIEKLDPVVYIQYRIIDGNFLRYQAIVETTQGRSIWSRHHIDHVLIDIENNK